VKVKPEAKNSIKMDLRATFFVKKLSYALKSVLFAG
jgi:hypothetical protein